MEENRYPLQRKWVLWEMWSQSGDHGVNSISNMQTVGEFQGVHEFWQHWNYLPHANPRMLFENPETKIKIIIESLNQCIDSIGLFEDKIKPVCDDAGNKNISWLSFDIEGNKIDELKGIWDKLVFSLIGETLSSSEEISGCRVIDNKKSYRFEIWCKFDGSLPKFNNKICRISDAIRELLGITEIHIAGNSTS